MPNTDDEGTMTPGGVLQTPKGVHDILPNDHEYYTYIKKVVRHRLRQAGFRRISTPMFEFTQLFQRAIGNDTDVVSKEMYTFQDRKGRSLTLKPEGTAGVVRSYIQNSMQALPQPVQLYYIEPHFRYDRPQKGRYRQFWQLGFEVIGESDAALDAQTIYLANLINKDLGIADLFTVQLNSIGTPESRKEYMRVLQDFYFDKERSLCELCKTRLKTNPMRLLDCKEENCRILAQIAPKIADYLDAESKEFHEDLKEYLTELGIKFVENPYLVRGLDYYTKTVFEFWDKTEGAQNAIGGGGRYDGLVELLGGKPTPAVGYAAGVERIVANMKREKIRVPHKDVIHIFIAQLGKEAKKKGLSLMSDLRDAGIKTMASLGKDSVRTQLGLADKFGAPYTIIIGLTEVREGVVIIRDMKVGTQKTVPFDEVIPTVVKLIGKQNLDTYSAGELSYE
ncbi:MAG: histidyl-tRNA synthetase, histidyl-tRNA synthetase [Candidatus Peregrinibacteria bacterium GW2011_GWF2_38_29]|nr:MAG: histidyl-tRNA synthetase, histidyl-tRNA synthetase [Candidatus Peregrinibacteria bacterium GW2011_GWF2_38_29]HBB02581.1 histidine--tRNA ligase [Candidatus Peregrinibacteria bacterium]